jgi:integrase
MITAISSRGHREVGGLYFRVVDPTKTYWVYRYQGADGKGHAMSLGVYPDLGLKEARDRHAAERVKLKTEKIDPLRERRAGKQARVLTFGKAADAYIAAHEGSWKTAAYGVQWKNTLATYCAPIRDTPVNEIDTEAVLRVLQPIWTRKPAVASMLRGRIEAVLDAARVRGHIDAHRANPARWRGHLAKILPKPAKLTRGHHAAMPYADVPAFMAKLRSSEHTAAKALALDILCASRPDEVLGKHPLPRTFVAMVLRRGILAGQ